MTYLVSGWLELDLGAAPDDDEGVEEVTLDARGRKVGIVGLQEDHADDIVPYVPLPLKLREIYVLLLRVRCQSCFKNTHLLGVILLEGEQGGDVEHDLDVPPLGAHAVVARQVVHCVQAALVPVETWNGNA